MPQHLTPYRAKKAALAQCAANNARINAEIGAIMRNFNVMIKNERAKAITNAELTGTKARGSPQLISGAAQSLRFRLAQLDVLQKKFTSKMLLLKVGEETKQITYAMSVTLDQICGMAVQAAAAGEMDAIASFAKEMGVRANRKQGLFNLHREVGTLAQEAVLKSYRAQVKGTQPYRAGRGRLPGQLYPALQRNDIFRAFADGLTMGNRAVLNHAAIHWQRLNYGTLPRAQKPPGVFPIEFSGGAVGTMSDLTPPRAAFRLPIGMWRTSPVMPGAIVPFGPPNSNEGFFPIGRKLSPGEMTEFRLDRKRQRDRTENRGQINLDARVQTRGIRGYRFFDAGVRVIASELPKRYEKIADLWFEESEAAVSDPTVAIR